MFKVYRILDEMVHSHKIIVELDHQTQYHYYDFITFIAHDLHFYR